MALYKSAAQRTRKTVVTALISALVALAIGWIVGRQQVPSIRSQVTSVQKQASALAIGIERLDIEYEQTLSDADSSTNSGAGSDTVKAGVLQPLDELQKSLQSLMDRAPWIGSPQRAALLDSVANVRSKATSRADLPTFRTAIQTAGQEVRSVFGARLR